MDSGIGSGTDRGARGTPGTDPVGSLGGRVRSARGAGGPIQRLGWVLALAAALAPLTARGQAVSGGEIVDTQGRRLSLRGVSWFGFETESLVVQGLGARSYREMIEQMRTLGLNAVRLPFCPRALRGAPPLGIDYALNPDLRDLDSLGVLDRVVAELDRQRMWVLLDHHRPDCEAISELWTIPGYDESRWIADLRFVARRYGELPFFLGVDLKNEPHGRATWGTGDRETDWKEAAERAAHAVLEVAPDALIFVEGVQSTPSCSSDISNWWGGNIEAQECFPLQIPADRLVLSPHVYGPNVFVQPYFEDPSFPENLPAIWDRHFGRFAGEHAVVIGEFGSSFGAFGHPDEVPWLNAFVDYLVERGLTDSFFWTWTPNSDDTGGLLRDDYRTLAAEKIEVLRRLWDASREAPETP